MKKIWVAIGSNPNVRPVHLSDINKIYYFKNKRTPKLPKF